LKGLEDIRRQICKEVFSFPKQTRMVCSSSLVDCKGEVFHILMKHGIVTGDGATRK